MKKTILALIAFFSLFFFIACDVYVVPKTESAQSPVSPELEIPFFILIQQNDEVQEGGKLKYRVQKGDVLKVLMRKTCRGGYGECWQVQNVKTGVIGYVVAQRMNERHSIRQNK
jgi:hypothetical protein